MRRALPLGLLLLATAANATAANINSIHALAREAANQKTQWAPSGKFSALHTRAVFQAEIGTTSHPYAREKCETAAGKRIWSYANLNPARHVDLDGRQVSPEGLAEIFQQTHESELSEQQRVDLATSRAVTQARYGLPAMACASAPLLCARIAAGAMTADWLVGLKGHTSNGDIIESSPDPITQTWNTTFGSAYRCGDRWEAADCALTVANLVMLGRGGYSAHQSRLAAASARTQINPGHPAIWARVPKTAQQPGASTEMLEIKPGVFEPAASSSAPLVSQQTASLATLQKVPQPPSPALLEAGTAPNLLAATFTSLHPQDAVIAANYQRYYNEAATQAITRFNQGKISVPSTLNWQTRMGQIIDDVARARLKRYLAREAISEGAQEFVSVNHRLYSPSPVLEDQSWYRIPDVYLRRSSLILDGTIGSKNMTTPQIVDFGQYSGGADVQIVRPQSGPLRKPR